MAKKTDSLKGSTETPVSDAAYREGELVVCPNTNPYDESEQATGTVLWCLGRDIMVLDAKGIIHRCKTHEVYRDQAA